MGNLIEACPKIGYVTTKGFEPELFEIEPIWRLQSILDVNTPQGRTFSVF